MFLGVHRFLARLDEVQEELLYYPWHWRRRWRQHRRRQRVGVSKMLKFLCLSFLCDGQGPVGRAILSL